MPKKRRSQPPRRATTKPMTRAHPKHAKTAKTAKPSKPKPSKAAAPHARAPVPATKKNGRRPAAKTPALPRKRQPASAGVKSAHVPVPSGPSSHDLAIDAFERGFRALQQRQFARAAELLGAVVSNFPDEKELLERARVYLSICARQAGLRDSRPRSFDERVNAATVAINRGAFDEGLASLRKLEGEEPGCDHVHYMLCVVYASSGEPAKALEHLRRAIELNPEKRCLSAQDADLEPLRQNAGFAALLGASGPRRRVVARKR